MSHNQRQLVKIDALQNQHDNILELIEKILNFDIDNEESVYKTLNNIQRLIKIIKIHNNKEEEFLYNKLLPKLSKDKYKEISQIYLTKSYLIQELINYKNQFGGAEKILNNKKAFMVNSKDVLIDWREHILAERKNVYSLLEDKDRTED